MEEKIKNFGLDIERELLEQSDKDWFAGISSLPSLFLIPQQVRRAFLPQGEIQRGREDMMDCATRGALNIFEAYFTYGVQQKLFCEENIAWLKENGYIINGTVVFSDAFIAILSGTTRQGNSLKAPLEAIRKSGLIPKKMLPLEPWMTFDDYHNPKRITEKMVELGKQFAIMFTVNYEKVYPSDFEEWLKTDMIESAGFAWPEPVNGEYPRTSNPFNHAFMVFNTPNYFIFDNYEVDGDFIKKLAADYILFNYVYRLFISAEKKSSYAEYLINNNIKISDNWVIALLKALRNFLRK